MTLLDPELGHPHRTAPGQTEIAEARATIEVLIEPIFTGQRYILLTLLEEQLRGLYPIEVMKLRDEVHDMMTQVRMDQLAGVHPKHNPNALHQVMMLID